MAVSLARFSWWYWSGKEKEPASSNGSSLHSSSSDWGLGLREQIKDYVKFSSAKGARNRMASSSSRKGKRKWNSREERRIDKEYDVVLVPSDGVCLSGSESDDSDWSIGWLEPHAPDFQSDDEEKPDNSFAVLVPCYRNVCKEFKEEPTNPFFSAIGNLPDDYSAESNIYMEQWLSSLNNF